MKNHTFSLAEKLVKIVRDEAISQVEAVAILEAARIALSVEHPQT